MPNPFELIIAGKPSTQVLKALGSESEAALDCAARKLTDQELTQLGIWASKTLRRTSVHSTLVLSGLLHVYQLATAQEDRRGLFDNMLEDLGISRTQAVRAVPVWNYFGQTFMREPALMEQFVAESLKLLAEQQTSPEARAEALRIAREGGRISIKAVGELRGKYPLPDENRLLSAEEPANPKRSNRSSNKRAWSYVGTVVRLTIKPKSPKTKTDTQTKTNWAIIQRDLESAIEQFRGEYDQFNH